MVAWKKNVILLGADMSLSVHIDSENEDVLILDEGPIQGLDGTTLTIVLLTLHNQEKHLY